MAKLTKRFVDGAASDRHYDDTLAGFGLYVGASGAKAYFLEYRAGYGRGGTKRRMTIGRHGAPWTPHTARAEAQRLLGLIRAGHDALSERRAAKTVTRLDAVTVEWLAEVEAKRKPRTIHEYRRLLTRHVLPCWSSMDVAAIDRPLVARLHHGLRATPSLSNHVVRMLSSFFTWCERHGYRADGTNPCRHVTKYREERRERFLNARELQRLSRALSVAERAGAVTPWTAGAIRLLVLTGARLGEVLGLRWGQVDLEAGCLRLPDSKTGAKVIHLNAPAREVLASLPRITGNPHVVCGAKRGAPLVNLEKPWRRVRKAALLDDLRLHDLRHSFASTAVAGGLTLPLIGALLGHANVATTARYAHLAADPVKAATELVGKRIAEAMAATSQRKANILRPVLIKKT